MNRGFTHYTTHIVVAFVLVTFSALYATAQKKKNTQNQPTAPSEAVVAQAQSIPAPSKMNQIKICVATPKTNLAPAETAAESLRNSIVKYLSGPAAEIVTLESLVGIQQQAEAAQKGCGYYLAMSLMQKKKGGGEGLGVFLKNSASAAPLLNDLGMSKTAQTVSTTATRSAVKLTTAGDLAVTIKAKDEVSLEYQLFNSETQSIAASGKIKAKAGKDGEDILSPMLEQSVNAVLTVAVKK